MSGLDSIEPTEEVQLGDVIETDRGDFLLAVAANEFRATGKYYRGIFTGSPLFQVLKEKKETLLP